MEFLWELFESLELPLLLQLSPASLLGVAAARWHWGHRHCRFFTIVAGHVYRSGAMPRDRLLRQVRKHGIRTVIDLRSARPEVEREKTALATIGVEHFLLPSKQVPRPETVDAVLALLDRKENRPVLIHCKHGMRRAAQFEAICRMEYQGWPNERALSTLRLRSWFLGFRPGSRSTRFVRSYVPRRARQDALATR